MTRVPRYAMSATICALAAFGIGCGDSSQPDATSVTPSSKAASGETAPQPRNGDSDSQKLKSSAETLAFTSEDGLSVTADSYIQYGHTSPFVLLFHQAGWSRGEYLEIAPRLSKMGFNCMAVDQRSGSGVNGVENETHKRAQAAGKADAYLDAFPDLVAAVKYARANYAHGPLVVWGSSYSASLVFRLAAEYPEHIDGVVAFAPGEYFEKSTGNKHYVSEFAAKVDCPVFVTSAKKEEPLWADIFAAVTSEKISYLPETEGRHGSSALWEEQPDSHGYWEAVEGFLSRYYESKE